MIDVFIDGIDHSAMGFKTTSAATGRPAYHPETMLNLYLISLRLNGIRILDNPNKETAKIRGLKRIVKEIILSWLVVGTYF